MPAKNLFIYLPEFDLKIKKYQNHVASLAALMYKMAR